MSLASLPAVAQEQFIDYFGGQLNQRVGDLGGFAFDADGDLWTVSFQQTLAAGVVRHTLDGSQWTSTVHLDNSNLQLDIYKGSPDVAGGVADNSLAWGLGTLQGFLLNPTQLEVPIPAPGGGMTTRVYGPGELAFMSDNFTSVSTLTGQRLYDAEKLVHRYDLRPQLSVTSDTPDQANAQTGDGVVLGSVGIADWNDILYPVATRADFRAAANTDAEGSGFSYNLAWSSDGQSLYGVYRAAGLGGLYKIDPRGINPVQQVWAEPLSTGGAKQIASDPAVLNTSVHRYVSDPTAVGDQIFVEGSSAAGNAHGINVFLDPADGVSPVTVEPLVTPEEFLFLSDYAGSQDPTFTSFATDAQGNLYFAEGRTDNIYIHDTQGRMAKIATRREHNLFQYEAGFTGGNPNDSIADLQTRPGMTPEGFAATEVIFSDFSLDVPVGLYAYKVGDFDRDNDLDADDLSAFAAVLGTRNSAADDADIRFDVTGDSVLTRNDEGELRTLSDPDNRFSDVAGPMDGRDLGAFASVIDWKDVKVLQQFALFPNGDTNFDFTLDFADLDAMAANYHTLDGVAPATWLQGDFASSDPNYLFEADDANLVDTTDLGVIAEAWVNDLGLTAPTEGELSARYSGDFLLDAIAAFAAVGGGIVGDYDGDGDVDVSDYLVWVADFGGSDLAADGNNDGLIDAADYTVWRDALVIDPLAADFNGDGTVDAADYTLWRDNEGQTGDAVLGDADGSRTVDAGDYQRWVAAFGTTATNSQSVPEPTAAGLCLLASFGLIRVRGWRVR